MRAADLHVDRETKKRLMPEDINRSLIIVTTLFSLDRHRKPGVQILSCDSFKLQEVDGYYQLATASWSCTASAIRSCCTAAVASAVASQASEQASETAVEQTVARTNSVA